MFLCAMPCHIHVYVVHIDNIIECADYLFDTTHIDLKVYPCECVNFHVRTSTKLDKKGRNNQQRNKRNTIEK